MFNSANIQINVNGPVQGWECVGRSGKGWLLFSLADDCIVSSVITLCGCTNFVRVMGNTTNRKATLQGGITVVNCTMFDVGCELDEQYMEDF